MSKRLKMIDVVRLYFPYEIRVSVKFATWFQTVKEQEKFCNENFEQNYVRVDNKFFFNNKEDALKFKLRWI